MVSDLRVIDLIFKNRLRCFVVGVRGKWKR